MYIFNKTHFFQKYINKKTTIGQIQRLQHIYYLSCIMPPKLKATRKSVSFQHSSDESVSKSQYILKREFPQIETSTLTIPFHAILMIFGLYKAGLTANASEVMLKGILSLIPLQLLYGYLITTRFTEKSKKSKTQNSSENVPLLLAGGVVISLVLSVPLFVLLILLGAPLASHLKETYLLSIHLSLLIFYPLLILYKYDYKLLIKFLDADGVYNAIAKNQILFSAVLAVIGTWFGIIPIPLDWDRDWQQWPITLLTGAYIGSFVGGVSCFIF